MGTGLASALKSKEELQQYFACHISTGVSNTEKRKRAARLKEFQTLYQPMIELGAQHFQMPYALTACVMFRESQFDPNATSNAGARGIAQFTADTYTTLRKDINTILKMEKDYQEYQKLGYDHMINYQGKDNLYMRCTQFRQREGILNRQLTAEALDKSLENCGNILTHHARYKPIYDNMITYLYDVNRHYSRDDSSRLKTMFPNTPRGHRPKGDDLLPPENFEDMLKEPAWVVAMNMFYLKQKMINTNAEVNIDKFEPSKDMIGYLATLAGSYNRGPATLLAAANGDKPSIQQWCKKLSTTKNPKTGKLEDVKETKDYMLSIRRCMTSNSFEPPANQANNPSCQGQIAPSTDDPCAPPGGQSHPELRPFAPTKSLRPRARQ